MRSQAVFLKKPCPSVPQKKIRVFRAKNKKIRENPCPSVPKKKSVKIRVHPCPQKKSVKIRVFRAKKNKSVKIRA